MAEKRMFAKSIVLSDAFLDMPMSARCLYFTLSMLADDDGFVSAPRSIMRQCGASQDDLLILLSKRYILAFDSGVIVIKHWRINNYLRSDRYTATTYVEEKSTLILDEKGSYTEKEKGANSAFGIPVGIPSIDKSREEIDKKKEDTPIGVSKKDGAASAAAPTEVFHCYGEYKWVKLTDEQYSNLLDDLGEEELARCIRYIDESAQSTGNKNKWKDWNLVLRKCHREGWGLNRNGGRSEHGTARTFGGNAIPNAEEARRKYGVHYDVGGT